MEWFEILKLIALIILFLWCMDLVRQNKRLKEDYNRLLKTSGKYEEMKVEAARLLEEMPEIKAIKTLRVRHRLSLLDAKLLMDEVKKGS